MAKGTDSCDKGGESQSYQGFRQLSITKTTKELYMELTYTQVGDYLIPNIAVLDTPHHTLGKYGRMRRTYLKEHRPILWNQMILDGTLWKHLTDVDRPSGADLWL